MTESDFVKAAKELKKRGVQEDIYLPVLNWPLFEDLYLTGKLKEIAPGVFDLTL